MAFNPTIESDLHDPPSFWQVDRVGDVVPAELPAFTDVAVVGGGLLGAATIYWLARLGARAVLLERGALAHGATGRNGGFVVAGTAEAYPAAIARLGRTTARSIWAMTIESRVLLRQVLNEEAIPCGYREPGHLSLALGEAQLASLERTTSALQADGFTTHLLDRQQVQEMIGTPLGSEILGGQLSPEDGLVNPALLVRGLASAAARRGASICPATEVTRIGVASDHVILETTRGKLRAGNVVVAANAWMDTLVPEFKGLVTPVRGQVLAYAPIAPTFTTGMSAALTPTGEYWQQTIDGSIVLGGCRAIAPSADVGVRSNRTTPEVQAALEHIFPRLFPSLRGLHVIRRWAGPMAFTPDYLPLADHLPDTPSVWVVGGFCGHGMPFGVRLGQLLAEAATSPNRPSALEPLRLNRATLATRVDGPATASAGGPGPSL